MSFAVRQRLAAGVAAVVAVVALLGSVVVAAPALADPPPKQVRRLDTHSREGAR